MLTGNTKKDDKVRAKYKYHPRWMKQLLPSATSGRLWHSVTPHYDQVGIACYKSKVFRYR